STVGASFSQDNNSSGVSQDSIWAGLRIFFSPCPIYHYSTFDVKLVSEPESASPLNPAPDANLSRR
ncbi:MAG: hypothetical protein L6277_06230, partial [Desulfobacterales bacterium]|nr:hypothetical protein [Pseudomonadota bacterium]MCG2771670.1 hypothetical protein [Desulfobacterales bacterium]